MGKMHQDVEDSCKKTAKYTQMGTPRKRCTTQQILGLIEYMSTHPRLAKNQCGDHEAGLSRSEEWTRLAEQLNKMHKMGTEKTVEQWRITWRDLVKRSPQAKAAIGEDHGEIYNLNKQPSQSISGPANPTPEVEEPKSPSSQLNSPEPSESESDSSRTFPTPSDNGPKRRCTMRQMISLIEYMSRHPKLAKNQFAPHEAGLYKKEWTRLTAHLNKTGSKKTPEQWKNTWRMLVRQTQRKALATKNKARAAEDVLNSTESSDEDDGDKSSITVWKQKMVDILKPSDEESGEEDIQTVSKQQSQSISVPANPTPEKVEEPKSPSSQLNSPEPPESESDSSCTSPTPSDTGPVKKHTQRRTMAQLRTLVECMALNPSMGFGPQDSNIADWQRLTELLSTMGPSKQVAEWQKSWRHMKSRAVSFAKRKDGVPLSLMKQKIIEIIAEYYGRSNALDESVKFDELPCPTEGMPVLFARSLSPPSRLNSPDLDNIGDLENSINSHVIGLNPEMSTLNLEKNTSCLGKSSSLDSGQMSPLRYDSDQSSGEASTGPHLEDVSNQQSSTQVLKQISPVTTGDTAAKDTNQTSSMPCKNERDSDGSFLPKTKKKIVKHEFTRTQKAALLDYMSTHTALATSMCKGKGVDTLDPNMYDEWRSLTKYLNKMGPAKTTVFWKRTWKELIVRSKRGKQTLGSNGMFQEVLNIVSEKTNSQDNSAKIDIDAEFLETVEGGASPTESDVELEILATLKGPGKNRCKMSQTEFLVDFMKENVDFAIKMRTLGGCTPAGCEKMKRLSKSLNKLGPPKSVRSWCITWKDLKRNALLRKQDNPALLPYHTKGILEIFEAHKRQAKTTEKAASMSGERQTDSSQQSRKTSELVENARCSKAQIAFLADYMSANPALATSEYKGPCGDDPTIEDWRQLSKSLNRMGVARSTTGWKQMWRNIVTCVRKSQQPNDWDEEISRKILKAVGDETIVQNHSELTIEIVEESGQMSPVHNFNQISPSSNTGRESPVNFDQMSPMHSTGHVSPVNFGQMSPMRSTGHVSAVDFDQMSLPLNTDRESPVNFDQMSPMHSIGHVSPVDFDQMSLVNIDQMSPMHNTGQVSLQSLDNIGQASVDFGQTSPVHNNRQSPVNTGQMSSAKLGQKSSGHNDCQINSGQAGDLETLAVGIESYIKVDPLYKKTKIIRSSRAQVKAIVNYMSTHPALAKAEEKSPIAVQKRQLEWRRLGKYLNRMGPTKSTDAWKHTWRDLKRSARTAKNTKGFQAQIYQQILNIMSSAKDGPIESSIDTVEEKNTLSKPRPTENISVLFARSPTPELCLNAPDPLQCDNEHSSDISRHKNSGEHSQQISFESLDSGQFKPDSTRPSYGQSNGHKEPRHCHQISPVPHTSGECSNVSTRFKESEIDSLQMSSAQRSSGQSNNSPFRHIETNDRDGSARERRVERSTQTRKQLNSLVDSVYAHPILASEQKTSITRHQEWRNVGKFLNKMGPIHCSDWKNRWKELKHDVARSWKKDGAYTGCIDSVRVKKVLELIAKYPIADRKDSEIDIEEDMPSQAPTTHHPASSVQHKVFEILSRNHTVDSDSINAGGIKRIATSNVENITADRDFIERSKEEGNKASSTTATTSISSEDTNCLLKELIGELKRSNDLKVEQNGILKQLVKQFSTDALKSNNGKKKEPQKEHVEPPVVQKREVEDLTEEYSTNTGNSERSGEHYAHTSIQDGPSLKDKVTKQEEDMPSQAPTTHHPASSVQHKVFEILSRNHTVDSDSINAGGIKRIATSNVENITADRDFIERSKEEGNKASSTTATTSISSEDTNCLLKELIGELKRSNDLKVEQNGILKQLVKQFSTDALKSNNGKKKEPQKEHVEPPVVQKREVEDLTEEYSTNTGNSERSGEHYAHTSIQDGPSLKDKVTKQAETFEGPQLPISSIEEATPSPKKQQIRIADITRLKKPTEPIQRVVKLKTTKVPNMPKVSLLRLKDGTMVVMPGTKLPESHNEYQTFVVGSVKHVDSEKVTENENEPAGFEDYEF